MFLLMWGNVMKNFMFFSTTLRTIGFKDFFSRFQAVFYVVFVVVLSSSVNTQLAWTTPVVWEKTLNIDFGSNCPILTSLNGFYQCLTYLALGDDHQFFCCKSRSDCHNKIIKMNFSFSSNYQSYITNIHFLFWSSI